MLYYKRGTAIKRGKEKRYIKRGERERERK